MNGIKTVLVTGAAGTVGSYVVGLLLKKSYSVIANDLHNASLWECMNSWIKLRYKHGSSGPLTLEAGNIADPGFIENLFKRHNISAVIHCAALIDVSLPFEKLAPTNLGAAVNLYRTLANANGRVFVFLSSGSIYKKAPLLTEETDIQPNSPYEQTKAEAENILRRLAQSRGTPALAVLRPSLIYGPRNKFLAANYLASAVILAELFGRFMPKFAKGPRTNFVHAEDVARAAVFLLESAGTRNPPGNAFNICDDSPLGFGDQIRLIANACGYTPSRLKIVIPPARLIGLFNRVYESPAVLKLLNGVLALLWKKISRKHGLKQGFAPDISPAMTPFFGQDTIFSNEKIKRAGFYLAHPDFAKGIEEVVEWYKKERWIP